jgi:hypothetical protein
MGIRGVEDGWEVTRSKKKPKKTELSRPVEGTYVLLKSLEDICKLHGVKYWEDIYNPEICEDMVDLFGNKVLVIYSKGYSSMFEAEDLRTGAQWNFRNEWININEYKIGLIPDELFEI